MRKTNDVEPQATLSSAVSFSTLPELLKYYSSCTPDAPAILSPGRRPLSYGRLYEHIEDTGRILRSLGIGRKDRLAIVLPNGPEMALAILALAANATCAPLNPAYGTEELDTYIANLRPRALIVSAGIDLTARRVALSRSIPIVELRPVDTAAGLFELSGQNCRPATEEPVSENHVAVLLLTSGTTSQPKVVPLTHAKICASATSSVKALTLTRADRSLNVVPLFHGHGLNNVLLAALAAGGSVVCTPGCDVQSFFGWLNQFRPTWYSAVPTMHQAILAQARQSREHLANYSLRFIRSSSAPLPDHVISELERTFCAPVIEFYGMTETASSPIACNPLPPGRRKSGSVGLPVDLDVAIMDERRDLLPPGQIGEVVVRGSAVMADYDEDPAATEAAFADDWFKTGDLGLLDQDGYLFLKGRLREVINRGGEKVSPHEVDELLLKHPAVAEAVTFALPHHTLGEEVAAAIVLRERSSATASEISQFAMSRIADFKVPRHILIVSDIPKSLTGKVKRLTLAAQLGLSTTPAFQKSYAAPRTRLESLLAQHWAEILGIDRIGIHDDFFAMGGNSLLATNVLARIYAITKVEFAFSKFSEGPTVAEVAHHLEHLEHAGPAPELPIVPVSGSSELMPASIAQERIWKFQQVMPDVPVFNVLYALRLTSSISPTILQDSINEIVRRHEMLRTTFDEVDGRLVQIIAPHLTIPLVFKDVHESEGKEATLRTLIQQELRHCFGLSRGPLIRAHLLSINERTQLFLVTTHVIIQDGWSLGVLIRELAILYDAFAARRASPLPPLPIQYTDFAHWQRCWRSSSDMVAQLQFWRKQLRDPLPSLKLGTGQSVDVEDFRRGQLRVACPSDLTEAARRFSQAEGVTLFMTLLAALKTVLHRYTDETDLRIATHVANRNRPLTELLIGRLVNTVILRTDMGGDPSFREVLRRVRVTALAAFANQDLPFEEVVATIERERSLDRAALAQVLFWLNTSVRPEKSAGSGLAFEELDPGILTHSAIITAFDVALMLRETANGLVGTCVYNADLFNPESVERLFRDFQHVLREVTLQPQRPIAAIVLSNA